MRLIKLALVLLISYFILAYYNIFSVEHGFMKKEANFEFFDVLKLDDVESFKNPFKDDKYIVTFEIKDKVYYSTVTEDELEALDVSLAFIDEEVEHKSLVPAIVGAVGIVVVILFVRKRR
ncbi:MAG: hypothetical protein E7184_02945 [Erysipelotrichaceae bacterium]|nr:hypothetical protein [Erysipelotrichaceae bacterium]